MFFDHQPRSLSYRLLPGDAAPERIELDGTLSLDGSLGQLYGQEVIDPTPGTLGTAVVELQAEYSAGVGVPVEIAITPDLDQIAYAVEHSIPEGWRIEEISDGGVFDVRNRKVKWGLFTGTVPTTLSYKAYPDFLSTEPAEFKGLLSVDGDSSILFGAERSELGRFARWAQLNFREAPHLSAFELDPDSDGLPNLLEYAYALNPLEASVADNLTTRLDADWFVVRMQLYRDDVRINPSFYDQLETWRTIPSTVLKDGSQDGIYEFGVQFSDGDRAFFRGELEYAP